MVGNAPHIPGCHDLSLIGERVARSLFSATSDRDGRQVTVTVFPPLSEGRTSDGFDRAAAVAQRLGAHPSVITIHDWGHAADGRPWIVTDPQPAESVDTLLALDGPLAVDRAIQVGVLLAGALETAHRAGILHGDLSPARLVFGAHGEPLLAETGLADYAVFPGLGALNNPVRYYAPPEVLERTEITPATDVYSLGTTVYALLAGRAPQQKPAEITDSNASLLLRILQMSVPRIERADLPPGLEDSLRAALAASPNKRPQQAIEMAWLLQDVQRRAGFAVTEPVVLDLDDLVGGPHAAPDASAVAFPLAAPPVAPLAPAAPEAPAAPVWPSSLPAEAPADAIAPAELNWLSAPAPTETPAEPLWPSTAPTEPGAESLWPSIWPADQPVAETPAWAAVPPPEPEPAPATEPAPPLAPEPVVGNDGGSIGDVAPPYQHVERPPELDELPAWYTDPLPNERPSSNGNGHLTEPAPAPWASPWAEPPPSLQGPVGGWTPPFAMPAVDPTVPPGDEPLPGAGDELRSLFGQVVGDPGDAGHAGPPQGLLGPGPDPLGPPIDRPPIDLRQLDTPLGPAPYLPPAARPGPGPSDGSSGRPPALPSRRGEVQRWSAAATGDERDRRGGTDTVARPVRPERSAPRQVAPVGDRPAGSGSDRAAPTGPPAMPLIVLIGVVAVLILGVAWLVLTGDDAEAPASDPTTTESEATAPAPTGVQAAQVAEGIQVSWAGTAGASYVVTMMSPDQPPRALPTVAATSVLVSNVELTSGGGRCFTVAIAPTAGAPAGAASTPVCTPGATVEGMLAG